MVDGRLVVKDGRLRTARIGDVRREANVRARRLHRSLMRGGA
jgi:hypothetical protein